MIKLLKRLFLVAAVVAGFAFMSSVVVLAAPFLGKEMDLKQPDGTQIKVKVYGDEFYHRIESEDGYTLIRDQKNGYYCYADLNQHGTDFVSTGKVYNKKSENLKNDKKMSKGLKLSPKAISEKVNKSKNDMKWDKIINDSYKTSRQNSGGSSNDLEISYRADESATLSGRLTGVTILVDFPEDRATISRDDIDAMMNQQGYTGYSNNGSVRDYFGYYSGGQLDYYNVVTDYYTAKYSKDYYDNGRSGELIREALQAVEDRGFNFSRLSVDDSNEVRAVNILYAGSSRPNSIWPHTGAIESITIDGVNIGIYQMTDIGSLPSIATIIHENGHMICKWPDTYGNGSNGVGVFDVMAYQGSTNPPPPNPYFRNIISGWGTAIDLNTYTNGSIIDVPQNSINSFIFRNSESDECFMIESIKKEGRYSEMPGEGLLIWHMDKNGHNDYEEMTAPRHFRVSVEQADGLFHLENGSSYGSQDDFFYAGNNNSFSPYSTPSSNWWLPNISPTISLTGINSTGTQFVYSRMLPVDITENGNVITEDTTSYWYESGVYAFDNSLDTKWHIFNTSGRITYEVKDSCAANITSYSISSANDYPERDPASWVLEGSNDNINWVTIDQQTASFSNRFETKHYNSFYNSSTFRYFRFTFQNNGGVTFQVSDIQLFGYLYTPQVISASGDNSAAAEGMDKAFDGNKQTKWLTFADSGWITYRFDAPFKTNMYSLTSANDFSGRNPKNWCLYGSNDNSTWVLLDKRKDQTFAGYFTKNIYSFNNSSSYLYYKLDVESTVSDPVLQLSEIEFYSIFAGSENLPDEGKDKAFDNDPQTKWLCFKNSETLQIEFMRPYAITRYALTSANDASDRNPKRWRVWASNGSWPRIQLDERAGQIFTDYFQRKEYVITNTTPYTHYQLEIAENNGGGVTQLAELEFLQ